MTDSVMLLGMASPAKSNKVFERVIPLLFWCRDALPINVMNVQIIFAAAMLASMVITLQSNGSIAAKAVVVFCLGGVLFQSIFIGRKPFVNAANFTRSLASGASVLRPGYILKVIAALRTHQNCSFFDYAVFYTNAVSVIFCAFLSKLISAVSTNFLMAASWLVRHTTLLANTLGKTISCLPMSFKSARFAAFHVWRSLINSNSAVRAVKFSVFTHGFSSTKLAYSHYSVGGKLNG